MAESYLPKPLSHAHSEALRLTTEKEAEYREAQLVANGYDPGIAREAVAMAFGRVCAKETGRMTGPELLTGTDPGDERDVVTMTIRNPWPAWACGCEVRVEPGERVTFSSAMDCPACVLQREQRMYGTGLATGTRERPPLNLPGLHAEERPGTGRIRIECDEGVNELTPEQMDAVATWWARCRMEER